MLPCSLCCFFPVFLVMSMVCLQCVGFVLVFCLVFWGVVFGVFWVFWWHSSEVKKCHKDILYWNLKNSTVSVGWSVKINLTVQEKGRRIHRRIKKNKNCVGRKKITKQRLKKFLLPEKIDKIRIRFHVVFSNFSSLSSVRKKWGWKMGKYISRGEAETNEEYFAYLTCCFYLMLI